MKALKLTLPVAIALVLGACASADTEKMMNGLAKAGLNPTQSACYSDTLRGAVSADAYNQMAEYLSAGEPLTKAINRTRRKFGADFIEDITPVKKDLQACTQ